MGHFDSALTHYQKMVALNDTLFNEAKARQISELQIQYETEKKDDNIQELTKQDQLQKKGIATGHGSAQRDFGSSGPFDHCFIVGI